MTTKTMKRNDTLPALVVRVVDSNGDAVNLTDCAATFAMKKKGAAEVLFKSEATIVDPPTDGRIQYDWVTTDTETAGTYYGEFEILFGTDGVDGKMTLPSDSSLVIQINKDLDAE